MLRRMLSRTLNSQPSPDLNGTKVILQQVSDNLSQTWKTQPLAPPPPLRSQQQTSCGSPSCEIRGSLPRYGFQTKSRSPTRRPVYDAGTKASPSPSTTNTTINTAGDKHYSHYSCGASTLPWLWGLQQPENALR